MTFSYITLLLKLLENGEMSIIDKMIKVSASEKK